MTGYFEPREYIFVIELGAGPFFSPEMGNKFSSGHVSIEFYNGPVTVQSAGSTAGADIVVPTAGELTITATESRDSAMGSYGTIPNGTVDVTVPYDRPNWGGPARFLQVAESAPVSGNGATHAVIRVLRT